MQIYYTVLKGRVHSSYSDALLVSDFILRDYHGTIVFSTTKGKSLDIVEGMVASLVSNAKSRRVIRARTALEAGIARWRGSKSLKFLTTTIEFDRASFSNTFIAGGPNACHSAFIKRLRRDFGDIQYIKVMVKLDDSLHFHYILNCGWVNQRYLSDIWEEITNCPVLDIRTLWYGRGLRNYLANYVSNQGRLGYSQKWIFPGWRNLTQRIFSRLKSRCLPYYWAGAYCANIFYRYVWYRRLLPFFVKWFNRDLLNMFALVEYPIFFGNWVPRCDRLFLYNRCYNLLFGVGVGL